MTRLDRKSTKPMQVQCNIAVIFRQTIPKTHFLSCMHSAHHKSISSTNALHTSAMIEWKGCLDFRPGQGVLGPKGHVLHTPDACDLVPPQPTTILPELHHHLSLGFQLPVARQTSGGCVRHKMDATGYATNLMQYQKLLLPYFSQKL